MEKINTFWIYGNTFGIIDVFNTLLAIGSEEEMKIKKEEFEKNEDIKDNAPFIIVRLTGDTSKYFSAK